MASVLVASVALVASASAIAAQQEATDASVKALPSGAKITVMQGTPATGPSTMQMALPDGYTVALHRHPTDESILVISGTYIITTGNSSQTLSAGEKATIKANAIHSERAQGPTVIEVKSPGAFKIIYVPSTTTPKAVTP